MLERPSHNAMSQSVVQHFSSPVHLDLVTTSLLHKTLHGAFHLFSFAIYDKFPKHASDPTFSLQFTEVEVVIDEYLPSCEAEEDSQTSSTNLKPNRDCAVIRDFFICFIKKQLFSSLGDMESKTLWVRRGLGEGASGVMSCRRVLQ